MNNFGGYLTPEEAYAQDQKNPPGMRQGDLAHFQNLAREPPRLCQCKKELVWKLVGTGLCFTCTTGENDASDDYELREERPQ